MQESQSNQESHKKSNDNPKYNTNTQSLIMIQSLNAAGSTDLATDHRGHDGPSWTPSSHTCAISFASLFITLNSKYDGSSQTRRSVEGLRSKTLKLLEYGYWDYFSELHDQHAGRTVIDTTNRHGLRNPTLGQTSPSSFSSYTMLPSTDRHKHDGLSQA